LPESIQLPAHLFSSLVAALQIGKGALLLPDYDENLFVPWASTGIDTTTLHRLRIPDEDVDAIQARGLSGIIWKDDEVRSFAPYFSRREASRLDKILLFPFVSAGTVQALLILLETPYLDQQSEFLRLILAAVGEPAALAIQKQRYRYLEVIRHAVVFKGSEWPLVAERLTERAPRGIHLLLLRLADVVSQVATANEHLDPYRVWQDVLRIVASLFASTGTVCDFDQNQLLICLHGAIEDDLELIVYHIGATIADLLPEVIDVPVLRFDSREYPSDGADLLQLAHSLM
jgi:hypothetical protein